MKSSIILKFILCLSFLICKADVISEIKDLQAKVDPVKARKKSLKKRISLARSEIDKKLANKDFVFDPVITVIIPCYNRQEVVKQAIDSVLNQKDITNVELVCVDDCSTDSTLKVLQEYEENCNNVFVYKHEKNKGGSAARNTAIVHARGKYIFNLDSDDFLAENTLSSVLNVALGKGSDIVYPGSANIFDHGKYHAAQKWTLATRQLKKFDLSVWDRFGQGWLTSVVCKLFSKDSWLHVGGFIEVDGHDAIAFSIAESFSGYSMDIDYNTFYNHRLWNDSSSKYGVEQKTNTLNLCPYVTLLNHLEVLTTRAMSEVSKSKTKIINRLSKLELLPLDDLNYLFEARKAKRNKDYSTAIRLYRKAIDSGVDHIKVKLEFANALYKSGQKGDADKILNFSKKEFDRYSTISFDGKNYYIKSLGVPTSVNITSGNTPQSIKDIDASSSNVGNSPGVTHNVNSGVNKEPAFNYVGLNINKRQFMRILNKSDYVAFFNIDIDSRVKVLKETGAFAFYGSYKSGGKYYTSSLKKKRIVFEPTAVYDARALMRVVRNMHFATVRSLINSNIFLEDATLVFTK